MNHHLVENFLRNISDFPMCKQESSEKYYKSTEKQVKLDFEKELNVACSISKLENELLKKYSCELSRVVKDMVTGSDLKKSFNDYNIIENKIEKEVSSNLYLCVRQVALSVKALYYYKIKDWDKSIAITLECNAINNYLIHLGVDSLVSRVFEQNKNICSIYLRDNKKDKAYALLFNLFNYLFNGVNNNLHGNVFEDHYLWKKVSISRDVYIYQMFVEIVDETVRFNFYNNDSFLPSDWYLNLKFEIDNSNKKVISDWIYVNRELRSENYENFFAAFVNYLNMSMSSHYEILKISLMIDFIKLIKVIEYSKKKILISEISKYLKNKFIGYTRIREIMIKKLEKYNITTSI